MNRIMNKALFYKEWINVRWVTLLTIIVLLYFKFYGVISALNQNTACIKQTGRVWTNRWFNNGLFIKSNYFFVMIFVIILLSVILFTSDKSSETQGFVASMPFTRKEIILNKWIVGVLSILVSFVVTYIFLSLFYVANTNSLDTALNPYSDIVRWFFMDTFQYICIFTFMMLAQTVMGNSIVSAVVGGIIFEVPFLVTAIVQDIVMKTLKYSWEDFRIVAIQRVEGWLNIYSYNSPNQLWVNPAKNTVNDLYRTFYYNDYGSKLLILFILTCLFLDLASVSYKRRNLEYNLRLIVFKNLEPLFVWGIALCSGLSAGITLGFGYNSESLRSFWIVAAIFTVVGYFISKLLIKIFSAK